MKIACLDIKAFGNITDVTLDFSSKTPGLHIIYGLNEAGKSTLLRALKGFLYGIPVRTSDNFLYEYSKLMIGGTLVNSDGKKLTFWRIKRNVGDLLDVDKKVLDSGILSKFLHGIEEPLFDTLFGIDHETLVSGGRDILEQKGEIGQALFSAGAGLSSLHDVIKNLEKEYEDLFKSGGSKPELNKAIREFQDHKKKIRDLSLSSHVWKEQEEALKEASRKLDDIDKQKQLSSTELERLKRLQRSLPHLSKRQALLGRLAALGPMDHLPYDFSRQLQVAVENEKRSQEILVKALSRKEGLEGKQKSVSVRKDVFEQAETIENFHQRLGAQRKAQEDRPHLHEEMIKCRAEAESLINQAAPNLNLSKRAEIKAILGKKQSFIKLGNRFARIQESRDQAERREKGLAVASKKAKRYLDATPEVFNTQELSTAINVARKVGDLDERIRSQSQEIQTLQISVETESKQLSLWQGSSEELLLINLPFAETIDRYAENFREANDAIQIAKENQDKAREELDSIKLDIKIMDKTCVIPTEDELLQSRVKRDKGWQLVKQAWLNGEDVSEETRTFGGDSDLPEAYEESVQVSDDLSDRLRNEVERVHKYATLLSQVEKLEEQLQRWEKSEKETVKKLAKLEDSWRASWVDCKVEPQSPREMRSWRAHFLEIRQQFEEQNKKKDQLKSLLYQRKSLRKNLLGALSQVGEKVKFQEDELEPVLVYADKVLQKLEDLADKRSSVLIEFDRLSNELECAVEDLKISQKALDEWQKEWSAALTGLAISEDASSEEATGLLEKLQTSMERLDKAEGLKLRLENIDDDQEEFDKAVYALVKNVAPELKDIPSYQAVVKLQALLTESRKAKTFRDKLIEDLEETEEEIRLAKVELKFAIDKKTELRKQARCDDDQLHEVDKKFIEFVKANEDLKKLEQTLMDIAEGVLLEDMEKQAHGIDPDSLLGQIEALADKIKNEYDPQIKVLSEHKGEIKKELQLMDGSNKAAIKQEDAQNALAKVHRLAEQYIRFRVAAVILLKEIDRYRKEHQDPILKIASKYFRELTQGSFDGLRSDVDDHGNQILVGVCPDEIIKTVGEMSSGTRDQLYLALRLATIEWRIDNHESIPFIADDILVNFDDDRSKATLKALANLAKKNQVVLFTHHKAVVNLGKNLRQDNNVVIHDLTKAS